MFSDRTKETSKHGSRRSARLTSKNRDRDEGTGLTGDHRKDYKRPSIDDVLGLTPKKPKGKNVQEVKAADAAEAVARRLDLYNVGIRKTRE